MDTVNEPFYPDETFGTRRCVIGCDPGVTGAVAVYEPDKNKLVTAWNMPIETVIKNRKRTSRINPRMLHSMLADAIVEYDVCAIVIEQVHSSPQMGVKSAFNFGKSAMAIEAIAEILHPKVFYVSPAKWKSRMIVPTDKKKAVQRARVLLGETPFLVKDSAHGLAEAAMIAMYGWKDLIIHREDPLA